MRPLTLWLLVAFTAAGCYSYVVTPMPSTAMPVLVAPEAPRLSINPKSYKFRIAVLDFIDQTNSAGDLVRTIPDILTTSLFDTQRYDIYDRGQLRDKSVSEVERLVEELASTHDKSTNQYKQPEIDGKIIGSITRFSPQEHLMTVDIRLINAQSSAVMFAVQQSLGYQGVLDVKVERADIDKLAKMMSDAMPKLQDARLVSKNSDEVVINVGEDAGSKAPKKGMAAFVIATGDTLSDPGSGDSLASNYIVAEIYITAVEQKITRGHIFNIRNGSWVQPGDLVHFK